MLLASKAGRTALPDQAMLDVMRMTTTPSYQRPLHAFLVGLEATIHCLIRNEHNAALVRIHPLVIHQLSLRTLLILNHSTAECISGADPYHDHFTPAITSLCTTVLRSRNLTR